MPPFALVLALTSASMHAVWNLLIARSREPEATTAVALVVGVLVSFPVAILRWELRPAAVPYAIASSLLELAYFGLLAAAYRRADLSVIYPLARGLAPVIVLVVGVLALGVATTSIQGAGVVAVATGVMLVRGLRVKASAAPTLLAVLVAVCIASYTLVDQRGAREAEPLVYLDVVLIIPALAYAAIVARVRGVAVVRGALSLASVVAGLLIVGSYSLVLVALQLAPAAAVSAVRESSVVIATVLAALVLRERVTTARLVGACIVTAGVTLLAIR